MADKEGLTESINEMRAILKNAEDTLRQEAINSKRLHSEVTANIILSIRHIEDARMRLGKARRWCVDI